jgi:protoheme IX farnesyltransferase
MSSSSNMSNRVAIATEVTDGHVTFGGLVRLYYELTKPGIVRSNALTAIAGYLFACQFHINLVRVMALLVGTACIIGASCVVNNYIDREIDAKMSRTKKRALVTGRIAWQHALLFSGLLFLLGFGVLALTNLLTVVVGLIAVFSYVVVYGIAKRGSVHGTLIGTLPGALSLVAGYTTATGKFDMVALALLLIMTAWQMPHFYAISIFRRDDYATAGIPVRSVSKGVANTKYHIVAYIVIYIVIACLLPLVSHEGWIYTLVMAGLGLSWLAIALKGWQTSDDIKWARQVFGHSLIVLLAFCLILPLGVLLP